MLNVHQALPVYLFTYIGIIYTIDLYISPLSDRIDLLLLPIQITLDTLLSVNDRNEDG